LPRPALFEQVNCIFKSPHFEHSQSPRFHITGTIELDVDYIKNCPAKGRCISEIQDFIDPQKSHGVHGDVKNFESQRILPEGTLSVGVMDRPVHAETSQVEWKGKFVCR
jgi:hypothetical protein